MQTFNITLFFALVSVALPTLATPMSLLNVRDCDALGCAIALGPTGVGCISAAAEAGANPIADAGCVAGALNTVANTPAKCSGCGSAVENAVGGAVDDVTSAIGSIF